MIDVARAVALSVLLLAPSAARAQQDRFVDVGTHSLHAVVAGSGSPVVVLESGLGLGLDTWDPVLERIAEFTTVLAYSRAGYGRSEDSGAERTLTQVSDDLVGLLDGLGVTEPVVLVGHSLGGMYVRTFAARYSDRTAGLVLVDSSHEHQYHDLSVLSPAFWEEMRQLLNDYIQTQGGATGPEVDGWWPVLERGTAPEAYPLPDVPMVVLTAQRTDARYLVTSQSGLDVIRRLHSEWVESSPQGRQVLVPESGHMIHEDAPSLVVEMVRSVVERARSGT